MGGAVDLHSHTTASDGALAPRELVRLAARHGVRVLAVTDHDSTEGLPEALRRGGALHGIEIVPGLEINCDVPGAEIHVLGYCVDWRGGVVPGVPARAAGRAGGARAPDRASGWPSSACRSTADEVFAIVQGGLGRAARTSPR